MKTRKVNVHPMCQLLAVALAQSTCNLADELIAASPLDEAQKLEQRAALYRLMAEELVGNALVLVEQLEAAEEKAVAEAAVALRKAAQS